MSRYHGYPVAPTYGAGLGTGVGAGCCNFSCIVILILIILQFGKCKDFYKGGKKVDNGILFIIALFFLACCGCGKKTTSWC
jgi:hypothetical protein